MQSIFPDFIDPMLGAPFLGGGLGGMDPFGSFYLPGQQPSTRRRIEGVPVPPGTVGRDPNPMGSAGWTRSIPVDFIERENVYLVRADIPGVHKNEIHIDVHDKNVLRFGHNPMVILHLSLNNHKNTYPPAFFLNVSVFCVFFAG